MQRWIPANRLVAAELERRWEAALQAVQTTREGYARFTRLAPPQPLTSEQREQLAHLSETLPAMWHNGQLSTAQQKELLRCLITRVIVQRTAPDTLAVTIVWVSGHYSEATLQMAVERECDVRDYAQPVARVQELWAAGQPDEEIAAQLTAEGFHSARAPGVLPRTVQRIRLRHEWYSPMHQVRTGTSRDGYLTVEGLAGRLGVDRTWVYRRLATGVIAAQDVQRYAAGPVYWIRDDPLLLARLTQEVGADGAGPPRAGATAGGEGPEVLCHIGPKGGVPCDE